MEQSLAADFLKELVQQVRSSDTYGRYDGLSEEAILRPFVVTKEERQASWRRRGSG